MILEIKEFTPNVTDITSELNAIGSKEKDKALALLSKFDIEWSEDRKLIKHYPLDDVYPTTDYVAQAKKLETIAAAFWRTVSGYIEQKLPQHIPVLDDGLLKAYDWNVRPDKVEKIGKIHTCGPARFCTIGKRVDEVKPFLYAYKTENGNTELMGEINFGIEIY